MSSRSILPILAVLLVAIFGACVARPGSSIDQPSATPRSPADAATPSLATSPSITISSATGGQSATAEPDPTAPTSPPPPPPPSPTPQPTSSAGPSASLDPATADAVRFRNEFGLRADLAWIAEVASRADAQLDYGVPLTPDEVAELNRRAGAVDAILDSVQAYTRQHADEFGGIYIDQPGGEFVVTLWTAHTDEHAAAIRALIAPRDNVGFRTVRYTESYLLEVQRQVTDTLPWMRTIGAQFMTSGFDTIANNITLTISSANPDAPRLIHEHLGLDGDLLRIVSDGTGIELLPRGTISGRVVDAKGRPVAGLALNWTSQNSAFCGDEVGHETDADGRFVLEHCTPTTWTVEVFRAYPTILGSAQVAVESGKTVTVVIRVAK